MNNKVIRNNLFKIKNDLDAIIKVLSKYGFMFNYHTITNLNKVTDFNINREYYCPNKTIILKDVPDINNGIGIIYNITENNILIIGTLGIGYLNKKQNIYMTNQYYLFDLNKVNSLEDIYIVIIKSLISSYILKYNNRNLLNKDVIHEIESEIKNMCFNIMKL